MGELRGDALSNGRDNRNTKASYVHETTVDGNGKELATEGSPGELVLHGDTIARSKRQRLSGWFTIACAGFALISDGYQNNLMTMLNVLLTVEYPADYTSEVSTRVSNALLVGAIVGQIVVGLICDRLGRKIALVTTTFLIIVGTSLVAGSVGPTTAGMFWMMTVARGITGFGVGGEYPASSTSAAEAANENAQKNRGPIFILVTNLPLSFGGPLAISIFLIVYSAAGPEHLSTIFRVTAAIGVTFPIAVFYFRIKMLTSKLYKRSAIKRNVPYLLTFRFYWRRLIGTCGAWFLYDFVTFPNGIFSGLIISNVVGAQASNIKSTAEWTLLLGTIALPGVFIGALLCNPLGRKYTMMLGFSGYLLFGLIIGLAYDKITHIIPLFVIFYGLMQSSGNLGPGNQLGLLSSECYATPVRGTLYGISAAVGKAGAAIGTATFRPIQNNLGNKYTFIIAACIGVVGVLTTFFFIPNLRGEDLAQEDEKFAEYLRSKGWTGQIGLADGSTFLIGDSDNTKA